MKFPTFTGERRAGKQMQRHASFKEIVSGEGERREAGKEGRKREREREWRGRKPSHDKGPW